MTVKICDPNALCIQTLNKRVLCCFESGETFVSLQYAYRIGRTTVGDIVHDTCRAIVSVLQPDYVMPIRWSLTHSEPSARCHQV